MALSAKLELRQGQALVMTPQLMQAIKLLQLSNLELVAFVEQELERNPFLERDEAAESGERAADGGEREGSGTGEGPEAPTDDWFAQELETSVESLEARLDTALDNVFPDGRTGASTAKAEAPAEDPFGSTWSASGNGGSPSADDVDFEAFVGAELSLADELARQAALAALTPAERLIAQVMIDHVDDTGYLTIDTQSVAVTLGADPAMVERVLRVLQGFDPPGVFARSLRECLALQLAERDRLDPAMEALLDHLDLVARRDFPALRRMCGVDDEDLADMIAEIRRLDPKPGLRLGSAVIHPVVPDVFVRAGPDGGWLVDLNSATLPKVLVNQTYHAVVARSARSDTDKSFLSDCLQSANWLTRSLEQRARTILKVATEIVRQQDGFLTHGVTRLRPLNLRTIADAIGMHESTVSRVTANKHIATPRGLFEMKYFFTAAIAGASGHDSHSAEAVRFRIKQMIDQETLEGVLSDDAIVARLRGEGIDIARRTVAKYREGLKIPSSVQRRREKQLHVG